MSQQHDAVEPETACLDETVGDEILGAMSTPELRQDPYRLYARMRRDHPVYRSAHGHWYLTRFADVDAALSDRRLSNDRERMTRALAAGEDGMKRLSKLVQRLGRVMTNTDPPDHTRLRQLVSSAFTVRRVHDLRPRIQAITDTLLDDVLAAGPTIDLVAAVSSPLANSVIFELFGIPPDDRPRVKGWFEQLANPNTTAGFDRFELVVGYFEDYVAGLIRARRAQPGDDIVSALVTAQERGDRLTDDELFSTCFMVLTAGVETTTNLIGNGVLALLRHPDQLRRLQQDPTLVRAAVQELARYDTTTQMVVRVVAEQLEIGGQTLDEGDLAYLVVAAANRDPERFSEPDRLDIGRGDSRNLSFGGGPHFCLGAPLARLEAEVAIGTLVGRLPGLRLAEDAATPVEWRPNPMLRGPAALALAY